MIYYIILTAFTVSIDSFLCGFSLAMGKVKKIPLVLIITFTVLIMCFITNYSAMLLTPYLNEKTVGLGGIILIGIGLFNLINKTTKNTNEKRDIFTQYLLAGVAVGLDGAIANLSLSLMGLNDFYVPIIIALCHGVMIYLSIILANASLIRKIEKFSFIAPLLLIGLGIYKIVVLI